MAVSNLSTARNRDIVGGIAMIRIMFLFVSLVFSPVFASDVAVTWKCRDYYDGGPVIVVAKVNEDRKSGLVEVAGTTHKTVYRVQGFDRQWGWGSGASTKSGRGYQFMFVIQPNGDSYYFDFKSSSTGSQKMRCKQK